MGSRAQNTQTIPLAAYVNKRRKEKEEVQREARDNIKA